MFKPMLAATVVDRTKLCFPFLASPKLDGIRCIIRKGEVLSRTLKPIKNKFIVSKLQGLPDMDGELIVGKSTGKDVFNRTTRGVMSVEGTPSFLYYAFDTLHNLYAPFKERLAAVPIAEYVMPVPHTTVSTPSALNAFEAQVLAQGYEGVMLRGIYSVYKCGRATAAENSLWKLKQFTDGELTVLQLLEGVINTNVAKVDARGSTTRSMAQGGMVPSGQVGTIVGVDLKTGQQLHISPGRLTKDERQFYWQYPQLLVGKVVKYKAFGYGSVDVPRFATFQGLRDLDDIS